MKNYTDILTIISMVVGFVWYIANQKQAIYEAIDERNDAILEKINKIERKIHAHEAECQVRSRFHEQILTRLEEFIDSQLMKG